MRSPSVLRNPSASSPRSAASSSLSATRCCSSAQTACHGTDASGHPSAKGLPSGGGVHCCVVIPPTRRTSERGRVLEQLCEALFHLTLQRDLSTVRRCGRPGAAPLRGTPLGADALGATMPVGRRRRIVGAVVGGGVAGGDTGVRALLLRVPLRLFRPGLLAAICGDGPGGSGD